MVKNPQRLEKVSPDRIDAINARLKEWGITREQMAKQLTNQPRCPYSATTLMKYAARGQGSHILTCFVESNFRYRKLSKEDLNLLQVGDLVVLKSFDRPLKYEGKESMEFEQMLVFEGGIGQHIIDNSGEDFPNIYLVYPPLNQD